MSSLLNQANLSAISPALSAFVFPFQAVGNPDLEQETMTAYEIGYTGVLGRRATVTAAVYWNTTDDAIFFTQVARYTAANPPVTWPPQIPTFVLNLIPPPGLPSLFTYRNLGTVHDKGIELGVDGVVNRYLNVIVNYSYQADPDVEGLRPERDELPGEQSLQRRLQLQLRRDTSETSWSATPARPTGRTCWISASPGRPRPSRW